MIFYIMKKKRFKNDQHMFWLHMSVLGAVFHKSSLMINAFSDFEKVLFEKKKCGVFGKPETTSFKH